MEPTLRKDGRWIVQVRLSKGPKGRAPVYGKTAQECRERAIAKLSASSPKPQGAENTYAPGTFGEFWISFLKTAGKAQGTKRKYKSIGDAHLLPTYGAHPISKITEDHILSHTIYLEEIGLSSKQRRNIIALLKQVFKRARKKKWIDLDPSEFIPLPDAPTTERVEMEEGFDGQLFAAAKGHWMEGPCYGARYLGMRRGEVCGLMKDCLDVKNNVVKIKRQRLERGELAAPKMGKVREIPVTPEIMEELMAFAHPSSAFVFSHGDGSPIMPNEISDEFPLLLEKAGLEKRGFHTLRAYASTEFAARTDNPWEVADILGHSGLTTTGSYVIRKREAKRKLVDRGEPIQVQGVVK